jgi:hypothetical protein
MLNSGTMSWLGFESVKKSNYSFHFFLLFFLSPFSISLISNSSYLHTLPKVITLFFCCVAIITKFHCHHIFFSLFFSSLVLSVYKIKLLWLDFYINKILNENHKISSYQSKTSWFGPIIMTEVIFWIGRVGNYLINHFN